MSSPGSWEFDPDWEITPDPFGDTRTPVYDTLFGTWDADKLELIGEEFEMTEKEYHEEEMKDKEEREGGGGQEHEVGKETNKELAVIMPYYPSGQTRIRRTARMQTPRLKRYSFSLSPPPAKRTKTVSGKISTEIQSTHERGESSHTPESMDETANSRAIRANTLMMEEMKKEIHSLKERVQMVEGETNANRVNLQGVRNFMGAAYNSVESYMAEANQRRRQHEVVTGFLAQQMMVTDARSVVNEARIGACELDDSGMQWQIDNLTYLFGTRFGFP